MTNSIVTYSPLTKTVYVGGQQEYDFRQADNLEPIIKVHWDKKPGDGRYERVNTEMFRSAERHYRQGVYDTSDISNIQVTTLLTEVIGRQWRQFFLREGCTSIPVPKIVLNIPIQAKSAASTKVPELVEATAKMSTFTQASFVLWKNVYEIMASDESVIKANINPLSFEIDQAAGALGKAINDQIKTEVETYTSAGAAGAWDTMVPTYLNFSQYNPLSDITTNMNTVYSGNQYRVDTAVMHPSVYAAYASNTFVNGYLDAMSRQVFGVFPLPKFPGITLIVDPALTSTTAVFYDKSTMLLGEGPTVAEQYRNPRAGANGYIIRQWAQPLHTTNNGGRKITGAHS